MEHLMTLRVYRLRAGEDGPSEPDGGDVSVTVVDSERVWRGEHLWAATSAWPPCRCPMHRQLPAPARAVGGGV
ncbi:hypothetical protein [Streptomyces sp. NPDC057702]|uniref:hypothetical protein n=1 Tax=unclassified Streptomyces TaxID=2593676 RepID=UPI0036BE4FFA